MKLAAAFLTLLLVLYAAMTKLSWRWMDCEPEPEVLFV